MSSVPLAYNLSVERIQAQIATEKAKPGLVINSIAQLHGSKTDRALLIFHGVTNSPEQFRPLGEMFYERGYNVYIPLHPRHGYADRTGRALIGYRLEEALEYATSAFEVASTLGERLTVMGLSAGANLTAWLAHTRPGIDLAVVMAPSLGIPAIPPGATRMAISLVGALPDIHSWWDPRTKINNPVSPPFAYAGFMTHAVLQTMRLGQQVKQLARNGSPLARRILLISNASDIAVSNAEISQLHKLWEGYPGFQAYVIPKEAQVEHDFITLDINAERNKKIYPKLLDLIGSD